MMMNRRNVFFFRIYSIVKFQRVVALERQSGSLVKFSPFTSQAEETHWKYKGGWEEKEEKWPRWWAASLNFSGTWRRNFLHCLDRLKEPIQRSTSLLKEVVVVSGKLSNVAFKHSIDKWLQLYHHCPLFKAISSLFAPVWYLLPEMYCRCYD